MTSKQFHLLFVHDDNKPNNGQIGQQLQWVVVENPKKNYCDKLGAY